MRGMSQNFAAMVTIVRFINPKRSYYSSEGECFVLHEIVE